MTKKQTVKDYLSVIDFLSGCDLDRAQLNTATALTAFIYGKTTESVEARLTATKLVNESLKTIQGESHEK